MRLSLEGGRVLSMDIDGDLEAGQLQHISDASVLGQFAFGGGWLFGAVFQQQHTKYRSTGPGRRAIFAKTERRDRAGGICGTGEPRWRPQYP